MANTGTQFEAPRDDFGAAARYAVGRVRRSMAHCIIAIGANLGARCRAINAALKAIAALPTTVLKASSFVYETQPWPAGSTDPPYLNAACAIETSLSCYDLLGRLQAIETALGRRREGRQQW